MDIFGQNRFAKKIVKNCENRVFRVIYAFKKNEKGQGHFLGAVGLDMFWKIIVGGAEVLFLFVFEDLIL